MQVVDAAAEAPENSSEEEAVAPRKSDSKRALARAQGKLVCAAKATHCVTRHALASVTAWVPWV